MTTYNHYHPIAGEKRLGCDGEILHWEGMKTYRNHTPRSAARFSGLDTTRSRLGFVPAQSGIDLK